MGIAKKRALRSALGPRTASKKLEMVKKAAACRRVRPGYPIEKPFDTVRDAREYLGSDRIVCLRCGKLYKSLNIHLTVHSWTVDQYKEFYGLPWSVGLASKETREKFAAGARRTMAARKTFGGGPPPNMPPFHDRHFRPMSMVERENRRAFMARGESTRFK